MYSHVTTKHALNSLASPREPDTVRSLVPPNATVIAHGRTLTVPHRPHRALTAIMDYAAHTAAAAPPAADPRATYPPGYAYAYSYPAYHYPDPSAVAPSAPAPASAASSSYYYSNPAAQAITGAQYNPYTSQYHYYGAPATDGGGGLADYYFTAGEASQAPSAAQTAPAASAAAAAGREAVKHFGFDPQRYAQVSALTVPDLVHFSLYAFRVWWI